MAGFMFRSEPQGTLLYGVAPWASRGPAANITVVGITTGDCSSPSRVTGRADAYSCQWAMGAMDPCFAPPVYSEVTERRVLCPVDGSVTRFRELTTAYMLNGQPAGSRGEFAVRLADGQTCWAVGTPGLARYQCPEGTLQGPLHGPRTRRTAQYLPTGRSAARSVRVAVAYR
ncbi:hypothetical protein CTZ27_25555 [Streptomyces griseocarneus]|nr:hypothetical protein CTZ27_25555 [Streptomyces griseocarneus]